jgi:hypothetical protein
VYGKDLVAVESLKKSIFDHGLRAPTTLLGGLKDEHNPAMEVSVFHEQGCRCQQHGGMPIVPTGMHLSCIPAGMGEYILLGHRKRIHVRPKTDTLHAIRGWARTRPIDDSHHPSLSDSLCDLIDPQESELLGDPSRGALLLETQFGVGMNVSPKGDERLQTG